MKYFRHVLCAVVAGAILGLATPSFANDDGELLKQAEDLVKQAWNPGGDPPSNRVDLITQAITLAQNEPDHRLRGTRMAGIRTLQQALEAIKGGESDDKVSGLLQDADRNLREAIEGAESH
jgi:hypothetical protein